MLTRDDIVAICPPPKSGPKRMIWDGYTQALVSNEGARLLKSYGVETPLRLVHLLATFAAETNLTVLWESGAYSSDGIRRVFGVGHHSARIGGKEAALIAGLPVDERTKVLFERVYGIRGNPKKARELGNTIAGDGWRFRGLGLNQMTGREAHEAAATEIGCSLDDLAKPLNCIHMALIEWDQKDCNTYADNDDAVSIRKLINGGSLNVSIAIINGLPEALAAVKRAKRVITSEDFETAVAGNSGPLPAPPASMAASTEAQGAVATGGGGAITLFQGTQAAIMKAAAGGSVSSKAIALALLAEPLFWAGLAAILGAAYWWFKRRRNLYLHGV